MSRLLPALLGCALVLHAQSKTYSDAEALQIHNSLLLIDTHNDVTSETVKGVDLSNPGRSTHTDIPRLKRGNVGATFFAVYVAAAYARKQQAAHRTLEMIDTVKRDIATRS